LEMMRGRREKRILCLSLAIVLLVLACAPCGLLSTRVPTLPRSIPTSPAAAQHLKEKLEETLAEGEEEFTLRLTEEEVTSYLACKLEEMGEGAPIKDLRIWFTEGKIHATGDLSNVLPVQTRVTIVASAKVANGQVQITIEKAMAGSVPLPSVLLTSLSKTISETLQEAQEKATKESPFRITEVEIREKEIIITGRKGK